MSLEVLAMGSDLDHTRDRSADPNACPSTTHISDSRPGRTTIPNTTIRRWRHLMRRWSRKLLSLQMLEEAGKLIPETFFALFRQLSRGGVSIGEVREEEKARDHEDQPDHTENAVQDNLHSINGDDLVVGKRVGI